EHRQLLPELTTDIAIAASDTLADISRDRIEVRQPITHCLRRVGKKRPARIKKRFDSHHRTVLHVDQFVDLPHRPLITLAVKHDAQLVRPAIQDSRRRLKANRVIHYRRSAYTTALKDLKAEITGKLKRPVGIKTGDHFHLIVAEFSRFAECAFFYHQYFSS